MTGQVRVSFGFCGMLLLVCSGCISGPQVPVDPSNYVRPDQLLDSRMLYKQNCAGCHGENGRGGAAIPLNNPAYLAVAGAQNLHTIVAQGMPHTLMPAYAQSSGGTLTDRQVNALVEGMIHEWGRPSAFSGTQLPPFAADTSGNAKDGQKAYASACARCHGEDGEGSRVASHTTTGQQVEERRSIVDPSYLALLDDQNLRSIVIAGHLDDDAPDWRSYIPNHPLSSQEITDIVAWMAAHRTPVSQQSIATPRTTPAGVPKKESQ